MFRLQHESDLKEDPNGTTEAKQEIGAFIVRSLSLSLLGDLVCRY